MLSATEIAYPIGELVDARVNHLKKNPWNPRSITQEMLESLATSMTEDSEGLRDRPCIALIGVDYAEDGTVIAGNQRLRAAQEILGWETIPTVFRQYSEQQARIVVLRDNNPWGQWDDEGLVALLREFDEGTDMALTGFDRDELSELMARFEPPDPEPDDRGTGLSIADVSVGDPKHAVEKGDVWALGNHVLVCDEVYDGWPKWVPYLDADDVLFVPYPTPTLPLSKKAGEVRLVMVQPDPWLAGHVLDKYEAVFGAEGIIAK